MHPFRKLHEIDGSETYEIHDLGDLEAIFLAGMGSIVAGRVGARPQVCSPIAGSGAIGRTEIVRMAVWTDCPARTRRTCAAKEEL